MPTIVLRRMNYYATEITDGYQWIVRQMPDNPLQFSWNVLLPNGKKGLGGFADSKEAAHRRVEETIAEQKLEGQDG